METLNFMARNEPRLSSMGDDFINESDDGDEVNVLRPMLYFFEGQKGVTMKDVRKFFTTLAIIDFFKYGYIERVKKK